MKTSIYPRFEEQEAASREVSEIIWRFISHKTWDNGLSKSGHKRLMAKINKFFSPSEEGSYEIPDTLFWGGKYAVMNPSTKKYKLI